MKPMTQKPYLIQRLEKPFQPVTFPMPKALEGFFLAPMDNKPELTDEERKWIRNALRCDYMGSAEFEFGTIPKAFHDLARSSPTCHQFQITGSRKDWRVEGPQKEKTVPVFLFCNEATASQAKGWVAELAKDDLGGKIRCKEIPYLNEGLFDPKSHHMAWFDIDLLWVATTSQALCRVLKALCKKP
jgi:hypothetical protein